MERRTVSVDDSAASAPPPRPDAQGFSSETDAWDVVVVDDPALGACRLVADALGAPLVPATALTGSRTERVVLVVADSRRARMVVDRLAAAPGAQRPALVVAWGLAEELVVRLLDLRVPVVDGSVVDDPTDALSALGGRWGPDRLARERALAEELAKFETYLEE